MERISIQRDARVEARYQVAQEHSLGHAYLAKPSRSLRPAFEEASRSLEASLRLLIATGDPADRAEAGKLQAMHAPSLLLLRQMLDAVDAGDLKAATEIHIRRVHPAYIDLGKETARFADREQAEATPA